MSISDFFSEFSEAGEKKFSVKRLLAIALAFAVGYEILVFEQLDVVDFMASGLSGEQGIIAFKSTQQWLCYKIAAFLVTICVLTFGPAFFVGIQKIVLAWKGVK